MAHVKEPRFVAGRNFHDEAFMKCYEKLGYPKEWIEEGMNYAPGDSYVISHPSWYTEEMPDVPDISIYELFHRTALENPDEIAVIFLDKPITYRDLDELACRYAAVLTGLGVQKGDVVAALLPNSLQHVVAFYGATKIGAIHTPINVMYQPDEIAYQIDDSGARVILALDLLHSRVKDLKESGTLDHIILTSIHDFAADDPIISQAVKFLWDIPTQTVEGCLDLFEALKAHEPLKETALCTPKEDTALLLYTAGTTGKSKGVIETHFNMVYNSLTHTHAARLWGDKEINFAIMPMFHTAGYFLHGLPVLYQGGILIPIPMFDIEDALRVIQQYKVNVIFAPPTLFIALMSNQEFLKKYDIGSLMLTIACGAPVPPAVQDQWHTLTGLTLTSGWGMTETNSGGCISIPGIKESLNSIGIPVYSEMKVVDDEGRVVPRNTEGEILYRGLQLAKGYWNKPQETREAFLDDGWFKTGDRGYIDEEDFVHFVDRVKDLIIASGYNLAPVEVENVIYQHPAVAEVAVIGMPHEYRGETVKAVVVLNKDFVGKTTEQDIIDFCKQKLATFKVPREIEFRDALPKSAVGKILRRVLRDEELQRRS
ncbi:MAG: class I adenylate-forming enzyme family protein [Desulfomonilia bacterium]